MGYKYLQKTVFLAYDEAGEPCKITTVTKPNSKYQGWGLDMWHEHAGRESHACKGVGTGAIFIVIDLK